MKKHFSIILSAVLFAAAIVFVMVPSYTFADASSTDTTSTASTTPDVAAAVSAAVSYLQSKPLNPWSIMALAAAGDPPSVNSTSLALASTGTSTAIGLESPILAITAIGDDPRTFLGGENLVTDLEGFYSTTSAQLGDTSTLNDDIFGLLAFNAAGVATSDPAVAGTRSFVLDNQNATDGGFAYAVGGTSDTNTTAAAVMALLATGSNASDTAVQNAVKYLKSAQNDDGGFSYDPVSPYGTSTDASSDSWIISAINALGGSPTSSDWTTASGTDPVESLLSLQNASSGFFAYQAGSGEDSFSPVTTAYGAIALLGKFLPVAVTTPSSTTASSTAATSTVATSTDTTAVANMVSAGIPTVQISYHIEGPSGELCAGTGPAVTAMDVLPDASRACGLSYHIQSYSYGSYVDQIGSITASGANGWLYLVNSVSPSVSAADYDVKANDSVTWYFGSGQESLSETAPSGSGASSGGSSGGNATSTPTSTLVLSLSENSATSTPTSTDEGETASTSSASAADLLGQLRGLEKEVVTLEFKVNRCSFAFNKNLSQGISDPDAKDLQIVLNYTPFTEVADTGAGSPGNETTYFGSATKNAVAAFQDIFSDQILAPQGLTAGNGYVGATTRAVLNDLCTNQ